MHPVKRNEKCFEVPQTIVECQKKKNNVYNSVLSYLLMIESTETCVLPPTDSSGCALLGKEREWRAEGKKEKDGCYPNNGKVLFPYHVWYDNGCNVIPETT
jgi:hypothetical protein